jgi:hypothetical protein
VGLSRLQWQFGRHYVRDTSRLKVNSRQGIGGCTDCGRDAGEPFLGISIKLVLDNLLVMQSNPHDKTPHKRNYNQHSPTKSPYYRQKRYAHKQPTLQKTTNHKLVSTALSAFRRGLYYRHDDGAVFPSGGSHCRFKVENGQKGTGGEPGRAEGNTARRVGARGGRGTGTGRRS